MRVVLDTNVIVSGLLWKGSTKAIFDLIEDDQVELCMTPAILDEVERVLLYPQIAKQLDKVGISIKQVVGYLLENATFFHDENLVQVVRDDPTDNVFINCAIVSGSQFVISGDKHLLLVKSYMGIQILKPVEFLKKFE